MSLRRSLLLPLLMSPVLLTSCWRSPGPQVPTVQVLPAPRLPCRLPPTPTPVALGARPTADGYMVPEQAFRDLVVYLARVRAWASAASRCLSARSATSL